MEKQIWKLGELCYITDISLTPGSVRMEILPARITREGSRDGIDAMGESISDKQAGKIIIAGTPFKTESAARAWIRDYIAQICCAGENIAVIGSRPAWKVPNGVPSIGDIVYTTGIEWEIIEVQVGYVSFESGQLEVKYDPSPNNPESQCIPMDQWYWTRKAAENAVYVMYDNADKFTFVSKEEVAARADAVFAAIWSESGKGTSRIFG